MKDVDTAVDYTGKMLNNRLITKQTGAQGAMVNSVMIAESLDFSKGKKKKEKKKKGIE